MLNVQAPITAPLCVDLDGTLLNSDLLIESGLAFVRTTPLQLLKPLVWLARGGKAGLKAGLAWRVAIDVARLPFNPEVLAFIKAERAKGRQIVLVTASHARYAQQVADYLQLFDRVLATEAFNLSSHRKADCLVAEYGEQGFDYMANAAADLAVWRRARKAYVVNASKAVEALARMQARVEMVMRKQGGLRPAWVKALRLHQWMKNSLVWVPLLAAHQIGSPELLVHGMLAFLVFGLCASSVYLLNDLLDLPDDRRHPSKRNRPFAAGRLPLADGLLVAPLLLVTAFAGAWLCLPWKFTLALGCYYLLTVAYSFVLKRAMMVDVIALGALYTLRIVGGAFACGLPLTFWLLAFSMFIFLSLALVKRYAELVEVRRQGKATKAHGRGYYPGDLEMLSSLGAASGYLAVMVLALYIQDSQTAAMYRHPQWIWLSCPLLLFWVSRTWMLTHRGLMHDDPVVFAMKDKVSLVVGALLGLIFWAAS